MTPVLLFDETANYQIQLDDEGMTISGERENLSMNPDQVAMLHAKLGEYIAERAGS